MSDTLNIGGNIGMGEGWKLGKRRRGWRKKEKDVGRVGKRGIILGQANYIYCFVSATYSICICVQAGGHYSLFITIYTPQIHSATAIKKWACHCL